MTARARAGEVAEASRTPAASGRRSRTSPRSYRERTPPSGASPSTSRVPEPRPVTIRNGAAEPGSAGTLRKTGRPTAVKVRRYAFGAARGHRRCRFGPTSSHAPLEPRPGKALGQRRPAGRSGTVPGWATMTRPGSPSRHERRGPRAYHRAAMSDRPTPAPTCPSRTSAGSSTRSRPRSARAERAASRDRGRPADASAAHGANGRVEAAVRQILLGDRRGPGSRRACVGTPERVHRMYRELTAGYHVDPERLINGAIFDVDYSEMVVVKDIPFYSLCEHHLLPFFGDRGRRLHPARPGHRPVEDPAHRRDVRAPAPGPGAADPADRRLPAWSGSSRRASAWSSRRPTCAR